MFLQPFLFLKLSFVDRLGELKPSFPDGTRWCPSSLAKLVHIISISLWFMVGISILFLWFINQLITGGAPPCRIMDINGLFDGKSV